MRRGAELERVEEEPEPALGLLLAILAGEENIREVIAFPKTQSGGDPLTNAPTPIDPTQLAELGLRVLPPPS